MNKEREKAFKGFDKVLNDIKNSDKELWRFVRDTLSNGQTKKAKKRKIK